MTDRAISTNLAGRESHFSYCYRMRRILEFSLLFLSVISCQSAITAGKAYYEEEQDYEKARQYLELGIQQAPDSHEAHYYLGQVHAAQRNFPAMAKAFARSLEISSEYFVTIKRMRARYYTEEYNRGIGLVRHHPADYRAGLFAFRNATIIDPEGQDAWNNLAYVYYRLDSLSAAASTYERILERNPGSEEALLNAGNVYIAKGEYDTALDVFHRLLEQSPYHDEGTRKLGAIYEHFGELEKAGELYRQLSLINTEDSTLRVDLGRVQRALGQSSKAIKAFESALELNPSDEEAFYYLAMVYAELGKSSKALPRLEVLAARMPDRHEVWNELSKLYAARGWITRSKEAAAKAQALSDNND